MKEAAEGLNAALMNLIDELDDNPTPAVGSPLDPKIANSQKEESTEDKLKQTQDGDKYVNSWFLAFSTPGKIFSRQHIETIFLFFPENRI